jgi:hypothetical protein
MLPTVTSSFATSFAIARVDRFRLHAALCLMGRRWLHNPDMDWSENNPTRNYCYVITEWVHRYHAPEGSTTWRVDMRHESYTHRFNAFPNGQLRTLVDLAAEQFPPGIVIPYSLARPFTLLQMGGRQPSRRAQLLQHLYLGESPESFEYTKDKAVGLWLRDTP